MMKLTLSQAPVGVALRSALAGLLLATAIPALAQFEAGPVPATQESASSDLIAKEMFTALVTVFKSQTGAASQVQHFAQNNPQSQQAPSLLGVEQVRIAPVKAAQHEALQSPEVELGLGTIAPPLADTSAKCEGDTGNAQCVLPGQSKTDWKTHTGVELDPISGAPLIPGVTLNPRGR